jgi:hypothetical protein
MFIERIPNRNSPPCILLRETYRHSGKVKHRTNLSLWMRRALSALFTALRFWLSKNEILPSPVPARCF